jgi:hypothetical protein
MIRKSVQRFSVLSKYAGIALPTLLQDEAGPEDGIVLPIFISASDSSKRHGSNR